MTDKVQVHSEDVLLPSRGLVYPASMGIGDTVNIKPFTNKDMKGLYASSGEAGIENLLENSINMPNRTWKVGDLIPQDRNTLLMRVRSITLGSHVSFDLSCGSCGEKMKANINLDELEVNYFDSDMQYPIIVELPDCKERLSYRILTHNERKGIEKLLDERAKKFPKFQKSAERVFYSFAKKINFVDKPPVDFMQMYQFYTDLSAVDATYLIFVEQQIEIGPKSEADVVCPHCGSEQTFSFNFSTEFFRPTFEKPKGLSISSSTTLRNNDEADDAE